MQNNEKDKSDLTFLGSRSIPCQLKNRVIGGKPPIPHEREQPKKLKGLHSPILCFFPLRGRRSFWYQKKSGGDKMCELPSCISQREDGLVKDALCDECRARVNEAMERTGKDLFDVLEEEHPLCEQCSKKARKVMKEFAEDLLGSDDADVK